MGNSKSESHSQQKVTAVQIIIDTDSHTSVMLNHHVQYIHFKHEDEK